MKRFAVLSDIHANSWALEAVLEDSDKRRVDEYWNLGDSLYGPLQPRKTFEILSKYPMLTVSGNEDRLIYEINENDLVKTPTLEFVKEELNQEAIEWLKKLPKFTVYNKRVFLCHGSPYEDTTYLLEDVKKGYPRIRSDKEIMELLVNQNYPLILCGHSHLPQSVHLENGQLVVNPGSVGLQAYSDDLPASHEMENCTNMASYSVIEETPTGWIVQFIRVPYNHEAAASKAKSLHREDWAHAILKGRVDQ